jgi:hypothetical protein
VKAALIAARENVALPNDPDGINEGVLNVGAAFSGSSASADKRHSASAEAKHGKDGKKSKHAKHKSKKRAKKH